MSGSLSSSLWLGAITAPVSLALLGFYGQWRVTRASEFELIFINLLFLLLILFPRLRSKLLRRRTWVNSWIRSGHWLRDLLQGGAIYLAIQLVISVPAALILLLELQHIPPSVWLILSCWGFLCSLIRIIAFPRLSKILHKEAASVLAREWATTLFIMGAGAAMLWGVLYMERPDFSQQSLEDALLFTARNVNRGGEGAFADLLFLSALKESGFWWGVVRLPEALSHFPDPLVFLVRTLMICLYSLYQLSVIFALSQLFAGTLEITDREFLTFLRGSSLKREKR